ncbi:phosphoribosyl-dephospho-CoA transferase [Clostridium acetobutylicum]|uniref:citrate lyase holo-[acyl-carrier protein] synthase n=1 Tax=Clostridium acetobutylicum (strain ATCC 824 / DSM 792 / JCM 1419 / IAM 19013 / LMG 5710 / NBRC 13948 / NRRL B-527 / VKM B-1787 / 2291 / W) TaxID=272562 RepID=Q97EM1_CLOAB|nr:MULTISPECIES: citrate lyase holo-[acyl-carrier protein] synthase [Clostridium]AAK81029.1 Hypothetical protein CA_C3089 [Clostridium acetobutylicum ATCC 824]ADZ22132.1 Conserved hypothetical protein [Clostridium acetobutylicum EA 2018]AEI32685.1 hypothetical protein SMB_G3125 [Clostridium acetobutylicum DSM 1731]AWV78560.1 hypothetical protein DK921_00240 [Clostridium acetobutylicum]KHD35718.1 hypothetical protein NL50_12170 [Clostridium acetobutylicum]
MGDNNILEQNDTKNSLRRFLLDKYKMTVVVVSVDHVGINGNNYSIDTTVDKISTTISQKFVTTVFLKIIKIIEEVPVIFIVIDEDSSRVANVIKDIKERNFIRAYMDVEVFDRNEESVLKERIMG